MDSNTGINNNNNADKQAIINLLQKENLALKNAIKEKRIDNSTFNSLLGVLELQREQINFCEEGLYFNYN